MRPPDLAKQFELDDRQYEAWQRLQKSALRFAASFLMRMMRTNEGKDAFFVDALAFAKSFQPPEPLKLVRKKRKRGRRRT